jgi:caffeoyl-CoA O-methyltransferase
MKVLNKPRPVTPLGILVEQLENTLEKAKKAAIPDDIIAELETVSQLAAGIDPYIEKYSTQESEPLKALAEKTASEDWSKRFTDKETVRQLEQEMLSGHLEGQTLKMFVYMTKAKRILEIGMFTGYSALAMAEALPEDGELVACEVDPYVANFAQSCFNMSPHGNKIKVKVAPALATLQQLADAGESFDLVFIDADKKEYLNYFQILLDQNLLTQNGFIFVDNSLFQGQVYLEDKTANGEAIAQFNLAVGQDSRVEQVILPLRDGLTLIRRK